MIAQTATHETCIAAAPMALQERLRAIQAEVERRVPGAIRVVSYAMPAFRLGRVFFYFSAFQRHVGIYPPVTDDLPLIAELAPFRNAKGNLAFPHNQPLPMDLIGRVALALALQYGRPAH
jgi:uncharacterized protein YdhG (YjbR/CyaY superfamily)